LASNGKNTYLSTSGKIATNIGAVFTGRFIDGYATLTLRNSFAIIDNNLNLKRFSGYSNFYNGEKGFITAKKGDLYGIIDINNNVVIDFQYEYLSSYSDGLLIFRKDRAEGQGYIDIGNNIIIPPGKFGNMRNFINGFAIVSKIGEIGGDGWDYGLINKDGEFVIGPEYKWVHEIGPGVYFCTEHSGDYRYFNAKGEEIIPH
jgi:hypothetical protein